MDVTTEVRFDGSCKRRIEYRLERAQTTEGETARPLDATKDPLRRLHRFPTGPLWTVRDEPGVDSHFVTVEADLPSPEAVSGDYWRVHAPGGRPTRNHVAFTGQAHGESASFEYVESFVDPFSPQESLRKILRVLSESDDAFASASVKVLGRRHPAKGDVRRVVRQTLFPLTTEMAAIAAGPPSGRWQRLRFRGLLDRLETFDREMKSALAALVPDITDDEVERAEKAAGKALDARFQKELDSDTSGWPMDDQDVRFHVTLLMPAPILRANTCFSGDTATWEFDQGDLYGPGFEMWAIAASQ